MLAGQTQSGLHGDLVAPCALKWTTAGASGQEGAQDAGDSHASGPMGNPGGNGAGEVWTQGGH